MKRHSWIRSQRPLYWRPAAWFFVPEEKLVEKKPHTVFVCANCHAQLRKLGGHAGPWATLFANRGDEKYRVVKRIPPCQPDAFVVRTAPDALQVLADDGIAA